MLGLGGGVELVAGVLGQQHDSRLVDMRHAAAAPATWPPTGPGSGMLLERFWDADARAVAVAQAAKSITTRTQQKTGCQLADDDLMSQVWSDEPPKADRPRLRFPSDRNTKTWQSRQRGARSLAQGCYGGIRNIVAHEHAPDWPQQLALEYLACLSVLARWIDEAEVEGAT